MTQTLKHFFIPHEGNNYHPHILHTKRAIFYAAVCLLIKGVVILFVVILPVEAFTLPDILEQERQAIIALTNGLRDRPLIEDKLLDTSAELKTADMVTHQYFDHVGPNQRTVQYFLNQSGYKYSVAGENLAMGFSSAEDVMKAWQESPTHYSNLVDADFNDIGVGIEAGTYQGIPTVFITQHFGKKKTAKKVSLNESGKPVEFIPVTPQPKAQALGEKVILAADQQPEAPTLLPTSVRIDETKSRLAWKEIDDHRVRLTATVSASGPVKFAEVVIGAYRIPLTLQHASKDIYFGVMDIPETPEALFRVVTMPRAHVIGEDGGDLTVAIPWEQILLVSPTPIEKYVRSKSSLAPLTSLFRVQKGVYLGFLIFFATALLLTIVVEIKRQHPKVIFQTSGLLLLIMILFLV